jgi:non-homologous end joining protein Ku
MRLRIICKGNTSLGLVNAIPVKLCAISDTSKEFSFNQLENKKAYS